MSTKSLLQANKQSASLACLSSSSWLSVLVLLLWCTPAVTSDSSSALGKNPIVTLKKTLSSLPSTVTKRLHRTLNLSSTFGSVTSVEPYERITSQPVFQVTTPWGSPYMIFERLEPDDPEIIRLQEEKRREKLREQQRRGRGGGGGGGNEDDALDDVPPEDMDTPTRPVALYFMDERDALTLRDEMKQMSHMSKSDLRITTTTLAKAMSQSSVLGGGLPTGQPIDTLTGEMKSVDEGGTLRYKIVPSKRELFYAARCLGKERVGLFADRNEEDAQNMLQNEQYIAGVNAMRRQERREREGSTGGGGLGGKKGVGRSTAGVSDTSMNLRKLNGHMEGKTGIPIFYCHALQKRPHAIKRFVRFGIKAITDRTNLGMETPLFFSYEDLVDSWTYMRNHSKNKQEIPDQPPTVEVYNLLDVITSMDKDRWRVRREREVQRQVEGVWSYVPMSCRIQKLLLLKKTDTNTMGNKRTKTSSGLENVVFVPNRRNVMYKERMTKRGNCKARLRPMRAW